MINIKELIEYLESMVAQSKKEKQEAMDNHNIYGSAFASGEIHAVIHCIHHLKLIK